MTPHLIEVLGRLSRLDPAELALVSATATSLAASSGRATPERLPASSGAECVPYAVARPVTVGCRPASPDEGRLDLLATTSWAEGLTSLMRYSRPQPTASGSVPPFRRCSTLQARQG